MRPRSAADLVGRAGGAAVGPECIRSAVQHRQPGRNRERERTETAGSRAHWVTGRTPAPAHPGRGRSPAAALQRPHEVRRRAHRGLRQMHCRAPLETCERCAAARLRGHLRARMLPRMSAAEPLDGQVGLITGGGRGIGANVARELADAGMRVAVAARSAAQVEGVAEEIGGLAVVADVSDEASVAGMVSSVEEALGPIELLVNNAGMSGPVGQRPIWDEDPAEWWRVFEVNVLGAYLCSRAVLAGMASRGGGRIVNVGSGAGYLPGGGLGTAYGSSKAALNRFGELLAAQVKEHGIAVFTISPGLVRTAMTEAFGDNAPWTPPECAPRLVRALASGRADRLSGRYIHAEHDDIEELIARADEIAESDLHAIRLQR